MTTAQLRTLVEGLKRRALPRPSKRGVPPRGTISRETATSLYEEGVRDARQAVADYAEELKKIK